VNGGERARALKCERALLQIATGVQRQVAPSLIEGYGMHHRFRIVSPMTVSRVVNGKGYVRQKTRKAVQAAITKLNYSPNLAARSDLIRHALPPKAVGSVNCRHPAFC
jgi:hypothetical protein